MVILWYLALGRPEDLQPKAWPARAVPYFAEAEHNRNGSSSISRFFGLTL